MSDALTDDGESDGQLLVRAFVAVPLDDAVRSALSSVIDRLRSCPARVAWVPAVNLHLSMVFLGNVPRTMVGGLASMLDDAVSGVSPFAVRVGGVGTFGTRVVWAGVDAPPALLEVQRRVSEGIAAFEIEVEKRPYRPHITLGRIKRGARDLEVSIRRLVGTEFGALPVNQVALMRSELQQDHAVYTPLHVARLQAT